LIDAAIRKHGTANVDEWITGNQGQRIHVQWGTITSKTDMRSQHRKFRNRRGKIPLEKHSPGWKSRVAIPTGSLNPYIKVVQQQVGKWKASIAQLLVHLGKSVPSYIRRHIGNVSDIAILDVSMLNDPVRPRVVFGTRFAGVDGPYKSRIQAAVRIRARQMGNRARLILSGYAKDISQGIKAQRWAHRAGTEPQGNVE
jgi:hypothetical protein